jgi:hypothetical protein
VTANCAETHLNASQSLQTDKDKLPPQNCAETHLNAFKRDQLASQAFAAEIADISRQPWSATK